MCQLPARADCRLTACPPHCRCPQELHLALVAPSLGGVETLVSRPATMSHVGLTAQQRHAAGIADGLVRVAVGIEDSADLVADFEQALSLLS